MGRFLRLINGVPRGYDESGSPTIYDESLTLVASAPGAGEILGPIGTGTPITLPESKTYSNEELEVFLNGQVLDNVFDYNYEGSIPRTQISCTFDLIVGDVIRFRIIRGA